MAFYVYILFTLKVCGTLPPQIFHRDVRGEDFTSICKLLYLLIF